MEKVKVTFKKGDRLTSYNAWNKVMPVAVKGVGQDTDAFQLPPMVRVQLPTDSKFAAGTKLYTNPQISLEKGLTLVSGVQVTEDSEENTVIYINNVSDSLATIVSGDVLAWAEVCPTEYAED